MGSSCCHFAGSVKGIDYDLTSAKVRNPYTIAASCRCISFGGRDDELVLQQDLGVMESCL